MLRDTPASGTFSGIFGTPVMKNCILIPSYNEARTIGVITKELKARGLEVYVVDDGSTDETAGIALSQGAVVIAHDKNKGKGASLIEGFDRILKEDFDAILVMDGDGQHATGDVDNFFNKMAETGADIVIGGCRPRIGDRVRVAPYTTGKIVIHSVI